MWDHLRVTADHERWSWRIWGSLVGRALAAVIAVSLVGLAPLASASPQPALVLSPNLTVFHVGDTVGVTTDGPLCHGMPGGAARLVRGSFAPPNYSVSPDLPVVVLALGTTNAEGFMSAQLPLPESGTFLVEATCGSVHAPNAFGGIVPTQITVLAGTVPPTGVVTQPGFTG